jgi:hypothetical protein
MNLLTSLTRIRTEIALLTSPEEKSAHLKAIDALMQELSRLRSHLEKVSDRPEFAEVERSLDVVLKFIEFAKGDDSLRWVLAGISGSSESRQKRNPIEIRENLTNEEIRELLARELTKAELSKIAAQRAIATSKGSSSEIRESILRNLERQEGYRRLAGP